MKEISNHRNLSRWVALISVFLAVAIPLTPLEVSWIQANIDPSRVFFAYFGIGILAFGLIGIPLWLVFFSWLPLTTIALGDKLFLPWWVRGGKTVLGAVVTLILSFLASLLFYYLVK